MHTLIQEEEPWLAGEPYTQYIRDAIRLRYALLPLFYTSFYEASKTGTPVIKPVFYENTQMQIVMPLMMNSLLETRGY